MIVVIEGPDNAGKTTLAAIVAKRMNALYIKAERPRRGPDLLEYQGIIEHARAYSGLVVTDRHVAISEPIYGTICRGGHDLKQEDVTLCISRLDAVVYCRPPQSYILETIAKREQMDGVIENAQKIIHAYDHIFALNCQQDRPRWVKYDYTNNGHDSLISLLERMPRHAI